MLASEFEDVVRTYGPRLTRFAFGFVRGKAEAEDVVQEVLWRVWEGRQDRHPKVTLQVYLYAAVRNHALNVLARQGTRTRYASSRQQAFLEAPADDSAPSVEDDFLAREDENTKITQVRAALARLNERQRTAVRLRYEQGLSMAEVAATLSVSVRAAEDLISRSIKTLRASAGHVVVQRVPRRRSASYRRAPAIELVSA